MRMSKAYSTESAPNAGIATTASLALAVHEPVVRLAECVTGAVARPVASAASSEQMRAASA